MSSATILDEIVARTREDVRARREAVPEDELRARLADRGERRPFGDALKAAPGVSVIAEHKRRAPSSDGALREGAALQDVVSAYERAGATALSVLTDEPYFGGTLADLQAARATVGLPAIRKDFVVEPYQVVETAAAGADAMLLIVAALEDEELARLHADATELGLDVLVEVHDARELERALAAADPRIIGVNNRDLRDFTVDIHRTISLLDGMPEGRVVVSESGIRTREQVEELARAGVDAVLVGTHLMRQPDLEAACRDLVGVA